MTDLLLYSTNGCHLCEQALAMLLAMPELAGRALEVLDIADDDLLVARWGEHIPVLELNGRRLLWPFDRDDVLAAAEISPASGPA